MKKIISITTLVIMLTGCSGNTLADYLNPDNLSSLIKPANKQPVTGNEGAIIRKNSVWTSGPIPVPVDMAAMRLKQHYGFVSDIDVTGARNSAQGNAGWSASAISEGTSWEAQPGSYYRMSRNWAGNDRLTLEVRGNSKESFITATYVSSNTEHLKKNWTARLWKQIPDVTSGSLK